MKICIPSIGDKIRLTDYWHFSLFPEKRNKKLGVKLGICKDKESYYGTWYWKDRKLNDSDIRTYSSELNGYQWHVMYPVTFDAGTELLIDRIYIRKGIGEFDSVSFWVQSGPYKGARFWAKLQDVNQIEFEIISSDSI